MNTKKSPKNISELSLSKYLAQSGVASRRKVVDLIKEGYVTVNHQKVLEPGHKLVPTDVVRVRKKVIKPEEKVYIMLNKPKGYITTVADEKGRSTIMNLLTDAPVHRLYPVGRLDKDTSGLLLITNDGDLAQALAHPKSSVRKGYHVSLDRPLEQAHMDAIKKGIRLRDGRVEVDTLSFMEDKRKNHVMISLHSGKNRIVRRIFEHFGYEILKLDRVTYAGLTKKALPTGRWRYLKEKDVEHLKAFMNRA